MSEFNKICLKIAAIAIPIGLVLVIIGSLFGAKKGMRISSNGISLAQSQDYEFEKYDYTDINEIKVDMSNAKIIVEETDGNKFGVKINLASIEEEPIVEVSNGILQVKEANTGWNIFSWNFDIAGAMREANNAVIIYVPKNTTLNMCDLDTSNGAIQVSSVITKKIDIHTSNGEITLEDVQCSGNVDAKSSNGKIICGGQFDGKTQLNSSNGKIEINGIYRDELIAKTSNGAIELTADDARKNYDIQAETSNGTVKVDGNKVSDDYSEDNNSQNKIDLNTTNGSITMNFK